MFRPELLGINEDGIHTATRQSMKECDDDIRKILCENVVLSGGNTLFQLFASRMRRELSRIQVDDPCANDIKVTAPPERKYSPWIGGSILSSLSSFKHMFITKQEYDENGPSIVHRKCVL